VFGYGVSCSPVKRCQLFGRIYCLHFHVRNPEDGGGRFLRNSGIFMSHTRRPCSAQLLLHWNTISQNIYICWKIKWKYERPSLPKVLKRNTIKANRVTNATAVRLCLSLQHKTVSMWRRAVWRKKLPRLQKPAACILHLFMLPYDRSIATYKASSAHSAI